MTLISDYIQPLLYSDYFWGSILFISSIYSYRTIWKTYKKDFPEKKWWKSLEYIIAHIPNSESRPWRQVVTGMAFCIGICLLGGATIVRLFDNDKINVHGLSITVAGFLFAILISSISFWTLWQTKRIEHSQGYRITDFRSLIIKLNEEIKYLIYDYVQNDRRAEEHHRVLLITTNPYFGYLSFKNEPPTEEFKDNILSLVNHVREALERNTPDEGLFKVEIICGNSDAIREFHCEFYNGKAESKDKAKSNGKADDATKEIESRLKVIENQTNEKVLTRVKNIPQIPQFAIIGNTLFDFTLDAKAPYTEISETNIVVDRKRCDIYMHTFKLLKEHLK